MNCIHQHTEQITMRFFFSWTQPCEWKPLALWSRFCCPPPAGETSSRWGETFSLPRYPPQSSPHTNTMGLCKAPSHTPLSDKRRGERYLAWKSFICCLWRSEEGCTALLCFVALGLKPLSFPQHMDVRGGVCSANLASCVTFWIGKKVDRILWPLHSKLVITQWPKAFFFLPTVSTDLVEKNLFSPLCCCRASVLENHPPLQ